MLPFGAFYGHVDTRRGAPGLEAAVFDADPHRVVERHAHEEAHFVLVLSGLYVSSAAGAPALGGGPLLVFNPAGTTHRDRFEARGRRFEGRFLTLSVASDLMDAADGRTPDRATVLDGPDAMTLAQRLARECTRSSADHAGAAGASGWRRSGALLGESLALGLVAAAAGARDEAWTTAPRWLGTARELLDDRFADDVRIADLARTVGVHPVHLARVFRRHVGCTPGDYARRRRLERSAVLLRETTRPLADVASGCGFADQSHFTHAFRRYAGVTPGAYRAGA